LPMEMDSRGRARISPSLIPVAAAVRLLMRACHSSTQSGSFWGRRAASPRLLSLVSECLVVWNEQLGLDIGETGFSLIGL
jgi:hypothetical protein